MPKMNLLRGSICYIMEAFLLFIDACVRKDSRTNMLANYLLSQTSERIERIQLADIKFPIVDENFLLTRDRFVSEQDYKNPMFDYARQFAQADKIVIAAPYWDLSFPAVLKQYFEQINVLGVTFSYSSDGVPIGLCKAKKLFIK